MNPRGGSRKDRGSVSPYSAPRLLGFLFALRSAGSPGPSHAALHSAGISGSLRRKRSALGSGCQVRGGGRARHNAPLCCALLFLAWPPAPLPCVSSVLLFQLTWLLQYMDREGRLEARPGAAG